MRKRLRQTIFATFLALAGIWVIWIFYILGELAYGVFSIPVLPNATVDFVAKNLLIFALLGSVDRIVDFILAIKSKALRMLTGGTGLVLAYFLICFYFYVVVQFFAALYDYGRASLG